jgi:hypothetical protein
VVAKIKTRRAVGFKTNKLLI